MRNTVLIKKFILHCNIHKKNKDTNITLWKIVITLPANILFSNNITALTLVNYSSVNNLSELQTIWHLTQLDNTMFVHQLNKYVNAFIYYLENVHKTAQQFNFTKQYKIINTGNGYTCTLALFNTFHSC